ncbi:CinA family protein [Mucilaginibacter ginkgonis]|uniref:Nicotinamide-nucleotide amidohydrolase family protein n=1 Tax=Mucilaginibacter ginkgonis TaxID=2682091 RepID=A0A6I4I2H5_9SPHI|nr:nicotinamide-nucleotide amidohydrolase family protein [Mucilaginibacter ginkgonis]QQL49150.1 nicotinamide-nucleotide amidohydrolase family protein [Mucilaginibacter ginkgonis]
MANTRILTCSKLLAEKELTIAFAESATAGWLCSEFALAPESGKVLKGAIVCYDALLKETILGVPKSLVDKFTPESEEVTRQMAVGLSKIIEADIYLAVTGLTTPGGSETPEKPVGSIFLNGLFKGQPIAFRHVFSGTCEEVIQRTIVAAAELIISTIQREDEAGI